MKVTAKLVAMLDIRIDKQRLDSTHIFSDMANFGRTRMMGVAIKRFLTQLNATTKKVTMRWVRQCVRGMPPVSAVLFADTAKDENSRRILRQTIAEDMYCLIKLFAARPEHSSRATYKALERVFYEQCEVQENRIVVKDKTGGNIMINTSDPDATLDGHKGPAIRCR